MAPDGEPMCTALAPTSHVQMTHRTLLAKKVVQKAFVWNLIRFSEHATPRVELGWLPLGQRLRVGQVVTEELYV